MLQIGLLTPLLEDESIASDAHRFKALLETIITAVFDYLVEHPRLTRMMLWEQAEGWQTYARIAPQFATKNIEQFEMLFAKARSAGLLRSRFSPVIQFTLVMQLCQSYLAFLPLYQLLLPGEEVSSAAALIDAREYMVGFVVHGMLFDH